MKRKTSNFHRRRRGYGMNKKDQVLLVAFLSVALTATPVVAQLGFAASPAAPAQTQRAVQPTNVEPLSKIITIIMSEPNFAVNGAYHELENGLYTKAVVVNEQVLAPLQDILESVGGHFEYAPVEGKFTMKLNDNTVVMFMDKVNALVNGKEKVSDVAPRVIGGRNYLPVRFVMENLGTKVAWEQHRTRVVITANVLPTAATKPLEMGGTITIETMADQPMAWYGTEEAQKVADNILGYQNPDGGWIKLAPNVNITKPVLGLGELNVHRQSTIDNDTGNDQIRLLARVYAATKVEKYKQGALRGLDWLLAGQYPNGGWSQMFPDGVGYQKLITVNDNAMANVLNFLGEVANKEEGLAWIDSGRIAKSKAAYDKGLAMLLKVQLTYNGKKTGWCQQYDPRILQPTMGRAFELASVSSQETTRILKFLMSINNPSPEIISAVQTGVAWLNEVKITGYKQITKQDPTLELGFDRIVVKDSKAGPMWARFYDIETNKPLFAGRDMVKRDELWEVPYERRNKYNWYNTDAVKLLANDYPAWQKKWAPDNNVLLK
jgi:PelA/Pel-15E family pectate lyase